MKVVLSGDITFDVSNLELEVDTTPEEAAKDPREFKKLLTQKLAALTSVEDEFAAFSPPKAYIYNYEVKP